MSIFNKKKTRLLAIALLQLLIVLTACSSNEKQQYYSEKENYINVTGTITHIKYNNEKDVLYLGFSDMQPVCDDNTFKIVGNNLLIVQSKDIDKKISIGSEVEFITAPRYFGDGYVMPIVSITIEEEELLPFEDGYNNLQEWLKEN